MRSIDARRQSRLNDSGRGSVKPSTDVSYLKNAIMELLS